MKPCAILGDTDIPTGIRSRLLLTVRELITERGVDRFLISYHGDFDCLAHSVLREAKKSYPHIRYTVLLPYATPCPIRLTPSEVVRIRQEELEQRLTGEADILLLWISEGESRIAKIAQRTVHKELILLA